MVQPPPQATISAEMKLAAITMVAEETLIRVPGEPCRKYQDLHGISARCQGSRGPAHLVETVQTNNVGLQDDRTSFPHDSGREGSGARWGGRKRDGSPLGLPSRYTNPELGTWPGLLQFPYSPPSREENPTTLKK